ncbi:transglutaminase family protein [Flavitalea sp. BT771]|uniref:transglutaminase family protein n=1 Tax=Flavitalea sp. BT771 TaxID=3063329 RepID=UPI0026E2F9B0|nr:transglutaminase family protein [Flavitalea sp. BT771]MDO6433358.1 transglutaminase family protein [Flavitalea sp. BT771]MDV6222737.1 transglutaminase family protein [Flavitalea sp. BT771]
MPRFSIHHITKYTYEGPVRDSANQIVLFPIKDEYQEVLKQDITITGDPMVDIYKDYYGNEIGSFTNAESHTNLIIDSRLEVITKPRPPLVDDAPLEQQWAALRDIRWQVPYIDFLKQEKFASLAELLDHARPEDKLTLTPLQVAQELRTYVYDNFKYIKGVTTVETTPDEVWKLKAGVCQDFAHILLVLLRQINIPARYVSGYICPNKNGMRGEGATHAWIEAFIPGNGWVGLDPTNNCIADDLHVRLAVGRSFSDCSPVKGTYKGTAGQTLEVGVSVSYESGKTTEDTTTILTPQAVRNGNASGEQNSYRRYMEMMQQQQQQQQQ